MQKSCASFEKKEFHAIGGCFMQNADAESPRTIVRVISLPIYSSDI